MDGQTNFGTEPRLATRDSEPVASRSSSSRSPGSATKTLWNFLADALTRSLLT